MILGFKEQFVEKIQNGIKKHTIRADKNNRWRDGMTIHFAQKIIINANRRKKNEMQNFKH